MANSLAGLLACRNVTVTFGIYLPISGRYNTMIILFAALLPLTLGEQSDIINSGAMLKHSCRDVLF